MKNRQETAGKFFLSISIIGALLILTETVLRFVDKSICPTDGCRLVARHARFGDISILLIGFLTFFLLTLISIININFYKPIFKKFINLILVVSLACEGFFTGYQAFRIYAPCFFCLSVSLLVVILGVIRIVQGEKEVLAGFASMAAIFSLFYLILPTESVKRSEVEQKVPVVGEPAPEFNLTLFNGQKIALKDFRGKLVIVNFWTSG